MAVCGDGSQLVNGGGVGLGVVVTVVCRTESRDAERLKSRSSVTASRSVAPFSLPLAFASTRSWSGSTLSTSRLTFLAPLSLAPFSPALIPAHCTVPPSPTVPDSHFCRPLFFFFRLKKQQHLEIKQTLIGLRIVSSIFFVCFFAYSQSRQIYISTTHNSTK